MIAAKSWIKRFPSNLARREDGASSVEYGLLVALIAMAIVVTVLLLGTEINLLFEEVTCFEGPPAEIC